MGFEEITQFCLIGLIDSPEVTNVLIMKRLSFVTLNRKARHRPQRSQVEEHPGEEELHLCHR